MNKGESEFWRLRFYVVVPFEIWWGCGSKWSMSSSSSLQLGCHNLDQNFLDLEKYHCFWKPLPRRTIEYFFKDVEIGQLVTKLFVLIRFGVLLFDNFFFIVKWNTL